MRCDLTLVIYSYICLCSLDKCNVIYFIRGTMHLCPYYISNCIAKHLMFSLITLITRESRILQITWREFDMVVLQYFSTLIPPGM